MQLPEHFALATPNDIPELEQLVNSAYRGESSKKGWTTEADLLDGIRTDNKSLAEMMEKPGAVILTYRTVAGELQACVYLEKKKDVMYLGMLTVSPTEQARGTGKLVMNVAENFAKQNGCTSVEMTVISQRQELIGWYIKRGYALTGEKRPFPTDPRFGIPKQPLEFVVMKKTLPA